MHPKRRLRSRCRGKRRPSSAHPNFCQSLPGLLPELGSPDLTAARDCRHDQVELALTQAAQECVTARNLPGTPVLLLAPFVTSTARIISAARLAEPWYMKGFRGAQVRMPSVKPIRGLGLFPWKGRRKGAESPQHGALHAQKLPTSSLCLCASVSPCGEASLSPLK